MLPGDRRPQTRHVAALQQLGRDTVEATVWPMSEAEALLLSRSLRFSPQESALEQGWLLSEMERSFGYSLDELARRFDRSMEVGYRGDWRSSRLLPEAVQQRVREGNLSAQIAMKYLVPVSRARQRGRLRADWRTHLREATAAIAGRRRNF